VCLHAVYLYTVIVSRFAFSCRLGFFAAAADAAADDDDDA